jgi:hypothetical protein
LPRLLAAIVVGFLACLANAWICLAGIDAGSAAKFTAVLVGGFAIGAIACRVQLFAGLRRVLAICAFVAALTIWIPVIFVTYGFALVGVPVLGLYSLAVLAGWRVSESILGQT